MNTKERILKFLLGRAISRQDYDEAKAGYEAALEGANDEQKLMATAYLQSVLNNQSANPKTNKHARHTGAEAYRIATTMLNGTFDEAAVLNPLGTTSVRTRRQDYADAGNVAADFMRKNADRTTSSGTGRSAGASGGRYYFDALKGLSRIGELAGTTTRGALVRGYAKQLLKNIEEAQNAENSGNTVYNGVDGMYGDIEALRLLSSEGRGDSDDDYNTLLGIAGKYEDGNTWKTWFGDYLPNSSEEEKRLSALKSLGYTDFDISGQNEYIKNLLKNRNINLLKDKAGNIKVFNRDWTDYTGGSFTDYNDDWTVDTDELRDLKGYGHGISIDSNGNVYVGNMNGLQLGSEWYDLYQNTKSERRDARKKLNLDIIWNASNSDTDDEFIQQIADKFGTDFKGSDVSQLFRGDQRVFAVNPNGGSLFTADDDGNIRFNSTTKFLVRDESGQLQEKSWADVQKDYNRNGFNEGQLLGGMYRYDDNVEDIQSNIDLNADMGGRNFWDAIKDTLGLSATAALVGGAGYAGKKGVAKGAARSVRNKALKGVLKGGFRGALAGTGIGGLLSLGETAIRYGSWDNINEDKQGFVLNLLNAIGNESGDLAVELGGIYGGNLELLSKLKYHERKDDYDALLIQMIDRDHSVNLQSLPPELQKKYAEIKKQYFRRNRRRQAIGSEKNGGQIVFAEMGTVLDANNKDITHPSYVNKVRKNIEKNIAADEARYQASVQSGYKDSYHKSANEEQMFKGNSQMSAADTLRIATMAQDAASIVASFVPGAGTGVAAGLGVTALGTDLAADILDPAVSAGEVAKNAVMNAGFAGLGLIPGAKMGKVAKNVIKYLPKIVTAAAGLGIAMDESTQKTFKKLGDGTTKLNREDWRNISHVLSLVAAGTRGIKGDIARYKVKKGIVASDNVEIKGITKTDANGKEIPFELPKDKVKAINEKLSKVTETKNGDATVTAKENAIKILTDDPDLKLTPEQAEAILKEPKDVGKAKVGKFRIEGSETTDVNKSYDNLRAIWNQEAQDVKASSKAGRWFANKFGGGDYTAKQRAVLENLENLEASGLMKYTGRYNPMIDWKNLRRKSGAVKMAARSVEEAPKKQKKILMLPEWKGNSTAQQPYNGSDVIADGIHQNPVRVESPIKTPSEIPVLERVSISRTKGAKDYSKFALNRMNGDAKELDSNSILGKVISPNERLSKESKHAAELFAKQFGIEIKDKRAYFRFILDLKNFHPELYRQFLSRKPITNPNEFMSFAKEDYNFKDGGKVNYQKLRK